MKKKINYFSQDIEFSLPCKREIAEWLCAAIAEENADVEVVNFIFCSDEYLHATNVQYLQHDTYTDVITFDYSERKNLLCSDIFISIERVRENSSKYNQTFLRELCTVMIHGILHLLGYRDETEEEISQMRELEKRYANRLAIALPAISC